MKDLTQNSDKKLGKGLSALLGDNNKNKRPISSQSSSEEVVDIISLEKIVAGIYQPRQNFDQNELEELANSIKEHGLIQPILLRKTEEDKYEIIAGERRFRAAKIANLTQIPCFIKKINNHEALEIAILENVQRSDLSLIEEANGYKQLIDEFSYTQEHIAKKIGKSRSHITNLLRLLSLPKMVREFLEKKLISMGHARAIINSNNPEEFAKKIIKESLTVRDVENLVRDEKEIQTNISGNIPAFVRNEIGVKFINNEHLINLQHKLQELFNLKTKLAYNSSIKKGKITIEFTNLESVLNIVQKLKI
jgi:ParB family chromosome partitioning protein